MDEQTFCCGCPYDSADPTCATHGLPREPRVFGECWAVIKPDGLVARGDNNLPLVWGDQVRCEDDCIPGEEAVRVRLVEVVEP